ncbi:hypothetical protein D3C78_1689990 [compost metagenome]
MKATEQMLSWSELRKFLIELDSACHRFEHEEIRQLLLSIPAGFTPTDGICDLVWKARSTQQGSPVSPPTTEIDFIKSEADLSVH